MVFYLTIVVKVSLSHYVRHYEKKTDQPGSADYAGGSGERGAVDCRCRGDAQSSQPRADDFACRRGASSRVAVLDALFKPVFDDYEYSS